MYDWVRALLDPKDIVQSPSSAKKQITPPPKFDLPEDDRALAQRRSRRSVSPSKKPSSPRKSRKASSKDAPSTPSTAAANDSLQEALSKTTTMESDGVPVVFETEEVEVKTIESPKKKGRKPKKAEEAEEEKEEEKEAKKEEKETKKEEKKAEKKKKAAAKEKEAEVNETTEATPKSKTSQTTPWDDMPFSLAEMPVPELEDMVTQAKEQIAAISGQTEGSSSAQVTKKRKPEEDDDEETAAESAQRVKKARVLEEKLKRERVRNRALFGVSAAFALA